MLTPVRLKYYWRATKVDQAYWFPAGARGQCRSAQHAVRPNARRELGEPQETEQGRDQRRHHDHHQPVRHLRVDQDAAQQRLSLRVQRLGPKQLKVLPVFQWSQGLT